MEGVQKIHNMASRTNRPATRNRGDKQEELKVQLEVMQKEEELRTLLVAENKRLREMIAEKEELLAEAYRRGMTMGEAMQQDRVDAANVQLVRTQRELNVANSTLQRWDRGTTWGNK